MFEGAVAGLLNRLLGKYVQDLDTEHLNVGIFSGNVNLTDLKLKPEALYELDLPIDVKIGTIGRVNLQIPWTGLYSQPVVVNIEDVLVLVGPAISNSHFDPDRERRLTRAAKRKILQDLEAESEILKGPQNFFEQLFTAIVNNLQIYVRNVHFRYEDSISSKDGPLACGFCLQSLSIETTNSKWKPSVTAADASTVYQMMRVESLSVYWNPSATVLDDAETAHITPMQYYNWKHYMLTGLDKFSMHHEDFEFLLKPVTCKVKVLINRSGEARVPRLLLDAMLQDSALQLSRRQYLSIDNLTDSFTRIQLNRKYRHLHPGTPVLKGIKQWWRYAFNVVLEQRVRPYTWQAIKIHRDNYNTYKQTYKSTLRSPNDTELKLDLQKCEDSLPIVSVVIAREQAKFELLSQEPDRIEVVSWEHDWWKTEDLEAEDSTRVELCVKTEKCRSLWSHLSSPERKRVCELIGYGDGSGREKSKQYIEHKINLTLANCSLTMMNRNKEILVVTLTQFLASLETRPSAKAYKLSARAESILVEGSSSDGELVPLVSSERGSPISTHLLALDFEKNPINSEADYGICCSLEPIELLYVEHAFTELINFFQTHSMTSDELFEEVTSLATAAAGVAKAVGTYAVDRRKLFQLSFDVKAPCVLLPEYGAVHKLADNCLRSGRVLILDISRIIIKTDLQPSNLALEDATCMELEEKLYDRLHAECSCQVLFCEWSEEWRERRKHADSELHLIPRIKAQVVFSNSIKKDYKLLPRYKLNISLSSFRLNLSDRIIGLLLDFADNLPVPVPNTVPVSLLDSGDFGERVQGVEAAALMLDVMRGDPGYGELVTLRQKIVAAYLIKNRAAESTFDKDLAKRGYVVSQQLSAVSEPSDEEPEVFARSVDLPGFDDNVSESNTIGTLLRFIVGEIVINLSRSTEQADRPYVMVRVSRVCLDVALMAFGPAAQLSVGHALLTDKLHHSSTGQYLELLSSNGGEELFNLLYRKVRADCPEFRSQFHSVEQALVADAGALTVLLHASAVTTLFKYLQYIYDKVQSRHVIDFKATVLPRVKQAWNYLMQPEDDPPVPPGATKFSYSMRASSISVRLMVAEWSMVEARLVGLESDCVFRANDRMIFKLCLAELHLDHLSEATLYPKLVWPDEDSVIEVKYVRHAPRYYSCDAPAPQRVKAHGQLRVRVGRVHVVLFASILHHTQHFLEPLLSSALVAGSLEATRRLRARLLELRSCSARLSLAIEIHAPVLLLPQKPSSPNLLVLNLGDLVVENFFKQINEQEATSPVQSPIIDNILVKLDNVTVARAVMTLAGTLEVQEPILESMSVRCDVKRCVSYTQLSSVLAHRHVLLWDVRARVEPVLLQLGQKDLATMLAVWSDNLTEGHYFGSILPSSPVEAQAADTTVKKLQAFFAQGEPVRKESALRFNLEGVELKLFLDMDEVLSSPVRDLNHGLAKLTAGELSLQLDWYSDTSTELNASLQSLLVEDIRPDPTIVIRRIFQSAVSSGAGESIQVLGPAVLELAARGGARGGARSIDLRVDTTRLNLNMPFLVQLARALLVALPGEKILEGGVVNHGYVGDGNASRPGNSNRSNRIPSSSDSTSGYYSSATSVSEDTPGLSISIQFRQPEIMFFTDLTKTEGHALLLRTELLIDYSHHANTENLVITFAGLQIISKLQSKLKNLPPQLVLKPCDVEYSRSFKNVEEGVKVKVSVSDIEVHIAATTVHTVLDIMEEITTELTVPEEKEPFNFATYNPKADKEDDLWSPHKLSPHVLCFSEAEAASHYGGVRLAESFEMVVPYVKVLFEIEHTVRVPVLVFKLTGEVFLHDWSHQLQGSCCVTVQASVYNERLNTWEPFIEPVVKDENIYKPWEINATVFQSKAYPMSTHLNATNKEPEIDTSVSEKPKKSKRKGFESETSADEGDTDNEMTFITNAQGKERRYMTDINAGNMSFLNTLDVDASDSENESGLMDKITSAIGHLFTNESSSEEQSDDEDSSAPEQSEIDDVSDKEDKSATEAGDKMKRSGEHKTVTLQEPEREDSVDSGLETESFPFSVCTYIVVQARDMLNVTLSPAAAAATLALARACRDRTAVVSALVTAETPLLLVNDIGPGSTVYLRTRTETDLAGNDRLLATADYYVDSSRPSTPGERSQPNGCDTSVADVLEEAVKEAKSDITENWDCFEGGFSLPAVAPDVSSPPAPRALQRRLTHHTLTIKLHDMDDLTILCPQRSVSKLHTLPPSGSGTRYCVVVDRSSHYNSTKIVIRSPLQIRNETSYALELFYKKSELLSVGGELLGRESNPFNSLMRFAVLAPHDTYNVPLLIAYHCRLYLLPSNFESYQAATQGIWWMELANDLGTPRDIICPAKADDDDRIFAMRILTTEGCQSQKASRSIPNYLVRVLPPLILHNRLSCGVHVRAWSSTSADCAGSTESYGGEDVRGGWSVRAEAGEHAACYVLDVRKNNKVTIDMHYLGLPWTGTFTLTPEMVEKHVRMRSSSGETDVEARVQRVRVRVQRRAASVRLLLYAPYWLVNKTALPLQVKGSGSEAVYEVGEEPLLWEGSGERGAGGSGGGTRGRAREVRLRVRVQQSAWCRPAPLAPAAPGLLVCAHTERRTHYRILLTTTLSELSPQLTKIVTLLPYFLVYNDTKRHLRFMEENEAADLWFDIAPQQCTPFWPQTDSMLMHCKYRDSSIVSQHFPIAKNHFTVLRMDKGSAICVEVSGGAEQPFTISFVPYAAGSAPVLVRNLCEDVVVRAAQARCPQAALLSPAHQLLYTWDDPHAHRELLWNIYNNKGNGFKAHFSQDGYGEEKVSFHSVKHSTLVATPSVTSKLSSTLKRLTPKSPEPCSSSSDDSDSNDLPENLCKNKKMRKDKIIVYWISYMDGPQRVFVLTQDERIAYQYRMKINSEKSNYEIYLSLPGVSTSICVPTNVGVKELAYLSVTDSLPRWEVHVNHKWKQLSPDLSAWIEDKYQTEQKKCQLKEYLHIDLEKMQMTKPFFSELRRSYSPALWLQLRTSETYMYCHLKLHRLQIDNQLNDAVFPTVLHPAPLSSRSKVQKPSLEIAMLKQFRPELNYDVYKYLKVLVQEHCINLDRGFVNHVFDILNHWKIEEKPAVRLRADLALVHMSLPLIAMKNQRISPNYIGFDYVHLSPLKFVLSMSSRGYVADDAGSPSRGRFGKRENRPKLFNSDLLEYLFDSWGTSLCDVKDVVFRMSYLEFRTAAHTPGSLLRLAARHYQLQLVQQFHVLLLGTSILGNPYNELGDFSKDMKNYYEPYLGTISISKADEVSQTVCHMLGHNLCGSSVTLPDAPRIIPIRKKLVEDEVISNDIPAAVIESSRTNPASVALALTGLVARPTFDDDCAHVTHLSASALARLTGGAGGRSAAGGGGERWLARARLPRHCALIEGIRPYSWCAALGLQLLRALGRGHFADTDSYLAHAHLQPQHHCVLLVTTRHIFLVRAEGAGCGYGWRVEWVLRLDELLQPPELRCDQLVLHIKQDEAVNYFSSDEKLVKVPDPEVLSWLHAKIQAALTIALEDKRCAPDQQVC